MLNRVVITGIGVIAPNGSNREAFFNNCIEGVSGIKKIANFDATDFDVKIGGGVTDFNSATIGKKYPALINEKDRKVLLGLQALDEALVDSGLSQEEMSVLGIHFGLGLEVFNLEDIVTQDGIDINRFYNKWLNQDKYLIQSPLDKTAKQAINRYGLKGPVYINCSACAAGAQAIGHSFHLVRSGHASIMLAGSLDSMLNPLGVGGFSMLGALTFRNDLGPKACRPFDISRDGTVLGEGSAMFILEELNSALKRNAKIYAEIVGFGSTLDAYKVSDPDPEGEGAYWAMKNAINDAHITLNDINYINAHGTGTPKNDAVETKAIKRLFIEKAYQIPISSTKSMIGHLIAASGAVELAACIIPFTKGFIPPTINLENSDPECDLDYVSDKHRRFEGNYVLSNSFGFGGQNATIILRRYK
jgi:3-oxoacyl-[acyl-carrier-protein] synthase II